MKAKYIVLIIAVVVILAFGTYYLTSQNQIKKISVNIAGVNFDESLKLDTSSPANIIKTYQSIKNLDLLVKVDVQNFSSKDFTLSQLFIEAYDEDERLKLGQIIEPIQPTKLKANSVTPVYVKVRVSAPNTLRALFGDGDILTVAGHLVELLTGFGELHKSIKLKGFVKLQNSIAKKKIDQTVKL